MLPKLLVGVMKVTSDACISKALKRLTIVVKKYRRIYVRLAIYSGDLYYSNTYKMGEYLATTRKEGRKGMSRGDWQTHSLSNRTRCRLESVD